MHEDLCKEIHKIVNKNKEIIFRYVDQNGKTKLNTEWRSQRNGFLNNLFEEDGFINMCYPSKEKGKPNLQKLKLKHIKFCKEKDERLLALGKNPEYNDCRQYNVWINERTTSFTREFLKNVSDSNIQTVKKYFITKAHPKGYDPRDTYRNSKLNCEIYNPKSRSYQQIPVENTPTNSLHPPIVPDLDQKSRGKGGSSIPSGDAGTEKKKSHVNIHPKTQPPASNSLISSPSNAKFHLQNNIFLTVHSKFM
ncbi:hypothetical protein POVWA1_087770 [Plasmodium ovale wallikeri]|uniref:PIR Superfamily Protein n=1 Tax=Plasmodium ovale wallikeri TaxID=864142 RepID=A0A1A9AP56_PLAOA|nr:hypothetical protein POVWA1_087770 [Plasmodium ovale wallikeri]